MPSLYRKYRPKSLDDLVGQKTTVQSIKAALESDNVPQFILLTGPAGSGKTTIARILKTELDCGKPDFVEINAADSRGIDTVRDIASVVNLSPIAGTSRIWLIDECHALTKDAQSCFLKLLEDTPKNVYFLFATTDPQKLLATVKTRATEYKLSPISDTGIRGLLQSIIAKEPATLALVSKAAIDQVVEIADGSARKALVLLQQIQGIADEAGQLSVIGGAESKTQAIELARALLKPAPWKTVAGILKDLKGEEPEGLRHLVLAYSTSVMLSGGPLADRAFYVVDEFKSHFYDSKYAGLVAACFAVITKK